MFGDLKSLSKLLQPPGIDATDGVREFQLVCCCGSTDLQIAPSAIASDLGAQKLHVPSLSSTTPSPSAKNIWDASEVMYGPDPHLALDGRVKPE